METVTTNLAGKTRLATLRGRKYIVAPMTMLVPGVLNGSKGPLLYPEEEVRNNHEAWNNMPIVVYHPTSDGRPVSARSPEILDSSGVGMVLKSRIDNGRLKAEGWFDVEACRQVDPRVLSSLERGEPLELSTGLFTENKPAPLGAAHNGRAYTYIARRYQPDHLAVLPDQTGACSLRDGCGVLVNSTRTENGMSLGRVISRLGSLVAFVFSRPEKRDLRLMQELLVNSVAGAIIENYSPSQARDSHGRWSGGSAGGGVGKISKQIHSAKKFGDLGSYIQSKLSYHSEMASAHGEAAAKQSDNQELRKLHKTAEQEHRNAAVKYARANAAHRDNKRMIAAENVRDADEFSSTVTSFENKHGLKVSKQTNNLTAEILFNYNPSQPRDNRGRWSPGGSASSSAKAGAEHHKKMAASHALAMAAANERDDEELASAHEQAMNDHKRAATEFSAAHRNLEKGREALGKLKYEKAQSAAEFSKKSAEAAAISQKESDEVFVKKTLPMSQPPVQKSSVLPKNAQGQFVVPADVAAHGAKLASEYHYTSQQVEAISDKVIDLQVSKKKKDKVLLQEAKAKENEINAKFRAQQAELAAFKETHGIDAVDAYEAHHGRVWPHYKVVSSMSHQRQTPNAVKAPPTTNSLAAQIIANYSPSQPRDSRGRWSSGGGSGGGSGKGSSSGAGGSSGGSQKDRVDHHQDKADAHYEAAHDENASEEERDAHMQAYQAHRTAAKAYSRGEAGAQGHADAAAQASDQANKATGEAPPSKYTKRVGDVNVTHDEDAGTLHLAPATPEAVAPLGIGDHAKSGFSSAPPKQPADTSVGSSTFKPPEVAAMSAGAQMQHHFAQQKKHGAEAVSALEAGDKMLAEKHKAAAMAHGDEVQRLSKVAQKERIEKLHAEALTKAEGNLKRAKARMKNATSHSEMAKAMNDVSRHEAHIRDADKRLEQTLVSRGLAGVSATKAQKETAGAFSDFLSGKTSAAGLSGTVRQILDKFKQQGDSE